MHFLIKWKFSFNCQLNFQIWSIKIKKTQSSASWKSIKCVLENEKVTSYTRYASCKNVRSLVSAHSEKLHCFHWQAPLPLPLPPHSQCFPGKTFSFVFGKGSWRCLKDHYVLSGGVCELYSSGRLPTTHTLSKCLLQLCTFVINEVGSFPCSVMLSLRIL